MTAAGSLFGCSGTFLLVAELSILLHQLCGCYMECRLSWQHLLLHGVSAGDICCYVGCQLATPAVCCVCLSVLQPNAEAQFLEVKNAFTVLSDPQQRADYDRKLRGVSAPCGQAARLARQHQQQQRSLLVVDFNWWVHMVWPSDERAVCLQYHSESTVSTFKTLWPWHAC